MNFCIAHIDYWHAVGFDTTYWRTSTDGTQAMCHDKFAMTLVQLEGNEHVQTYGIDSEEFKLIVEEEFTEIIEV